MAVLNKIQRLQKDVKRMQLEVQYDIYDPVQMMADSILSRHHRYAEFIAIHGLCNDIDKN